MHAEAEIMFAHLNQDYENRTLFVPETLLHMMRILGQAAPSMSDKPADCLVGAVGGIGMYTIDTVRVRMRRSG